jgi:hypothetical protein
MTTSLASKDWIIIIAFAFITIVLAYFFGWLVILILLLFGSVYLIYRWYGAGKPLRPT